MGTPTVLPVATVLVSGVDVEAMDIASLALAWDLPQAVAVRHHLDPQHDVLTRTVSDATGVLEHEEIRLDHACVHCAIREDVVPTLQRLARTRRWRSIVARLPATAEPVQVCRMLETMPHSRTVVNIAAVIAALDGETVVGDIVGSETLAELELPVRSDDHRGIGEVTSALVEYADALFITGEVEPAGQALLEALRRPDCLTVADVTALDSEQLIAGIHRHDVTEQWIAPDRLDLVPAIEKAGVWVLDFHSDKPFHPEKLYQAIELLGGGARRSRGCFWLPSRPGQLCEWDGAGGQLSVGAERSWGRRTPFTRIVVVGIGEGKEELADAFEKCLVTDSELTQRGKFWEVTTDGFEPWLGAIRRAA